MVPQKALKALKVFKVKIKALKVFIKPFEAQQRSVKILIQISEMHRFGMVKSKYN